MKKKQQPVKPRAGIAVLKRLRARACFLRDGGRCIRCGTTQGLSPSHIYPQGRYPNMAWLHENVKTLCFYCHIYWWHKNPIEAYQWVHKVLPKSRLARLKAIAQKTNYPRPDLVKVKSQLLSLIQRYERQGMQRQ